MTLSEKRKKVSFSKGVCVEIALKERQRGGEAETVYKGREIVHLGQSQVLKTSPP